MVYVFERLVGRFVFLVLICCDVYGIWFFCIVCGFVFGCGFSLVSGCFVCVMGVCVVCGVSGG